MLFQLDPYDYVDGFILTAGYYEEEVLDGILASLKPSDVFWDVGANLGLHALTVAKLRPTARVYAFEPNPKMSTLIGESITANQAKVELLKLALDSQRGDATFYLSRGNSGRGSLHNWGDDSEIPKIVVRTITAEEVVTQMSVRAPNVLKIDIEGNEERMLLGMGKLLTSPGLHTIVFEDSIDAESGSKKLLRNAGFVVSPLVRREATHHLLDNFVARRPPA